MNWSSEETSRAIFFAVDWPSWRHHPDLAALGVPDL